MATTRGDRLAWWCLVVGLLIGLIAMHGLAGHGHDPSPASGAHAVESSCCDEHSRLPTAVKSTSPVHGSTSTTPMHLCLAVLTGVSLLAALALLAFVRRGSADLRLARAPATWFGRSRSPPASVRLTQLCVQRC